MSLNGWKGVDAWAGEDYLQELLEQVDARPGPSHFGKAVQAAEPVRAERLVVEGLKRMGWSKTDLEARPKGDPKKMEPAWQLCTWTTLPLDWIAARLNMGSGGHLAWLLQRRGQSRLSTPADQGLLRI